MPKKITVLHVIVGLSTGGAETMLYKLVSESRDHYNHIVISLTDIGPIGKRVVSKGIDVIALKMNRGSLDLIKFIKLAKLIKKYNPDIIQTWMYHADLIGGLAAKFAGGFSVIWNIRQSNLEPQHNKKTTILTAKASAYLSKWLPQRIICCSESTKVVHENFGYESRKMIIIPNGFDIETFKPNKLVGLQFRKELGMTGNEFLIGIVGRYDSQKDHRNFINAASILSRFNTNVRFILCGDGVSWENQELSLWIDEAGIRERCYLLGRRDDVARIYNALDIFALSSCGEGFPNVIGEAMACGIPCVVTDVGDSAKIVGSTGKIVEPKNSQALAEACQNLINLEPGAREKLGDAARTRIIEEFSLPLVVTKYEDLYKEVFYHCAAL